MAETINKIIIEMNGTEYEFSGGGGQLGPHSVGQEELKDNSVGTDEIIDGSVEMDDLNEGVKSKIQKTYHEDDESLHMDFDVTQTTQEAGADSGSSSGNGADLDDLDDGGLEPGYQEIEEEEEV